MSNQGDPSSRQGEPSPEAPTVSMDPRTWGSPDQKLSSPTLVGSPSQVDPSTHRYICELEGTVSSLRSELTGLSEKLTAMESQDNSQLRQLQERNVELQTALMKVTVERDTIRSNLEAERASMQSAMTTLEQKRSVEHSTRKSETSQVLKLTQQRDKANTELFRCREALRDMENQLHHAKEKNTHQSIQLRDVQKQRSALRKMNKDLKAQLASVQDEMKTVTDARDHWHTTYDQLVKQAHSHRHKAQLLKSRVDLLTEMQTISEQEFMREMTGLREQSDALHRDIAHLKVKDKQRVDLLMLSRQYEEKTRLLNDMYSKLLGQPTLNIDAAPPLSPLTTQLSNNTGVADSAAGQVKIRRFVEFTVTVEHLSRSAEQEQACVGMFLKGTEKNIYRKVGATESLTVPSKGAKDKLGFQCIFRVPFKTPESDTSAQNRRDQKEDQSPINLLDPRAWGLNVSGESTESIPQPVADALRTFARQNVMFGLYTHSEETEEGKDDADDGRVNEEQRLGSVLISMKNALLRKHDNNNNNNNSNNNNVEGAPSESKSSSGDELSDSELKDLLKLLVDPADFAGAQQTYHLKRVLRKRLKNRTNSSAERRLKDTRVSLLVKVAVVSRKIPVSEQKALARVTKDSALQVTQLRTAQEHNVRTYHALNEVLNQQRKAQITVLEGLKAQCESMRDNAVSWASSKQQTATAMTSLQKQNAKLQADLVQLQATHASTSRELTSLRAAYKSMNTEHAQVTAEFRAQIENLLGRLQAETERETTALGASQHLQARLSSAESSLQTKSQEMKAASMQIDMLTKAVQKLGIDKNSARAAADRLRQESVTLSNELKTVRESNVYLEQSISALKEGHGVEMQDKNTELAETNAKLLSEKQETAKLRLQIQQLSADVGEGQLLRTQLQSDIEALRSSVESNKESRERERGSLQETIATMKTEHESTLSTHRRRVTEFEVQHSRMVSEKRETDQALNEARAANETMRADFEKLQESFDAFRQTSDERLASEQRTIHSLQQQIKELSRDRADLTDRLSSEKAVKDDLAAQSQAAQLSVSQYEGQMQAQTDRIASLEANIAQQTRANQVLLTTQTRTTASVNQLRRQLEARSNELSSVQKSHAELTAKHTKLAADQSRTHTQWAAANDQLRQLRIANAGLKVQADRTAHLSASIRGLQRALGRNRLALLNALRSRCLSMTEANYYLGRLLRAIRVLRTLCENQMVRTASIEDARVCWSRLRPRLGTVFTDSVTQARGCEIKEVHAGSPAEACGLMAGDVIQAVDGEPVLDRQDFGKKIRKYAPGDHVNLRVVRTLSSTSVTAIDTPGPTLLPSSEELNLVATLGATNKKLSASDIQALRHRALGHTTHTDTSDMCSGVELSGVRVIAGGVNHLGHAEMKRSDAVIDRDVLEAELFALQTTRASYVSQIAQVQKQLEATEDAAGIQAVAQSLSQKSWDILSQVGAEQDRLYGNCMRLDAPFFSHHPWTNLPATHTLSHRLSSDRAEFLKYRMALDTSSSLVLPAQQTYQRSSVIVEDTKELESSRDVGVDGSVSPDVVVIGDVSTISGDVNTVSGDANTNSGDVSTISGDVNTNSGDVNTNSGDVNTNSGDVNTVSGDVNTNSGDVNTVSGEVNTNSGDVNTVSGDVNTNSGDVNTVSGADAVDVKMIPVLEDAESSHPPIQPSIADNSAGPDGAGQDIAGQDINSQPIDGQNVVEAHVIVDIAAVEDSPVVNAPIVEDDISVNARNDISVNAQNDISVNAQNDISVNEQNDISVNAQNDISVNAQNDIFVNDISVNAQNDISVNDISVNEHNDISVNEHNVVVPDAAIPESPAVNRTNLPAPFRRGESSVRLVEADTAGARPDTSAPLQPSSDNLNQHPNSSGASEGLYAPEDLDEIDSADEEDAIEELQEDTGASMLACRYLHLLDMVLQRVDSMDSGSYGAGLRRARQYAVKYPDSVRRTLYGVLQSQDGNERVNDVGSLDAADLLSEVVTVYSNKAHQSSDRTQNGQSALISAASPMFDTGTQDDYDDYDDDDMDTLGVRGSDRLTAFIRDLFVATTRRLFADSGTDVSSTAEASFAWFLYRCLSLVALVEPQRLQATLPASIGKSFVANASNHNDVRVPAFIEFSVRVDGIPRQTVFSRPQLLVVVHATVDNSSGQGDWELLYISQNSKGSSIQCEGSVGVQLNAGVARVVGRVFDEYGVKQSVDAEADVSGGAGHRKDPSTITGSWTHSLLSALQGEQKGDNSTTENDQKTQTHPDTSSEISVTLPTGFNRSKYRVRVFYTSLHSACLAAEGITEHTGSSGLTDPQFHCTLAGQTTFSQGDLLQVAMSNYVRRQQDASQQDEALVVPLTNPFDSQLLRKLKSKNTRVSVIPDVYCGTEENAQSLSGFVRRVSSVAVREFLSFLPAGVSPGLPAPVASTTMRLTHKLAAQLLVDFPVPPSVANAIGTHTDKARRDMWLFDRVFAASMSSGIALNTATHYRLSTSGGIQGLPAAGDVKGTENGHSGSFMLPFCGEWTDQQRATEQTGFARVLWEYIPQGLNAVRSRDHTALAGATTGGDISLLHGDISLLHGDISLLHDAVARGGRTDLDSWSQPCTQDLSALRLQSFTQSVSAFLRVGQDLGWSRAVIDEGLGLLGEKVFCVTRTGLSSIWMSLGVQFIDDQHDAVMLELLKSVAAGDEKNDNGVGEDTNGDGADGSEGTQQSFAPSVRTGKKVAAARKKRHRRERFLLARVGCAPKDSAWFNDLCPAVGQGMGAAVVVQSCVDAGALTRTLARTNFVIQRGLSPAQLRAQWNAETLMQRAFDKVYGLLRGSKPVANSILRPNGAYAVLVTMYLLNNFLINDLYKVDLEGASSILSERLREVFTASPNLLERTVDVRECVCVPRPSKKSGFDISQWAGMRKRSKNGPAAVSQSEGVFVESSPNAGDSEEVKSQGNGASVRAFVGKDVPAEVLTRFFHALFSLETIPFAWPEAGSQTTEGSRNGGENKEDSSSSHSTLSHEQLLGMFELFRAFSAEQGGDEEASYNVYTHLIQSSLEKSLWLPMAELLHVCARSAGRHASDLAKQRAGIVVEGMDEKVRLSEVGGPLGYFCSFLLRDWTFDVKGK